MPGAATRRYSSANYWPGFVDALAALLVVVVFLVMVFALAQVFLSEALSGRDSVLEQLTREIDELSQLLDLERNSNAELRISIAQLSSQLQSSVTERDALVAKLASVEEELASERRGRAEAIAELDRIVAADRETIELQLRDLERLNRDIAALRTVRDDLEQQIAGLAIMLQSAEQQTADVTAQFEQSERRAAEIAAQLAASLLQSDSLKAQLEQSQQQSAELTTQLEESERQRTAVTTQLEENRQQLGAVRDLTKELEARLAGEQERTLLAQKDIEERDIRLAELLQRAETAEQSFAEERSLSEQAQAQVSLLNQQLSELRKQLAALNDALLAAEAKNEEQNTQIVNLGKRLNAALATRVQELARYRSEFFGRLREVLGNRQDIRIVGDRFVFQSEVLFASGAAELNQAGSTQLRQLAATLRQISAEIPGELDWVLRVDGHTDERPISTAQFPSNWELSSARAISVVQFLIANGIPPNRLVAAGFGQYQPLDTGRDEIAYRRNRRIEFKLTQR